MYACKLNSPEIINGLTIHSRIITEKPKLFVKLFNSHQIKQEVPLSLRRPIVLHMA